MKKRVFQLKPRIVALAVFLLGAGSALRAQTLQITSPADGTVVSPGQVVVVTVAASGAQFNMVTLLARSFPNGNVLTSSPYEFSIQIPSDNRLGRFVFTASGTTGPGQVFYSDPISIDVERPDAPISLSVNPSILTNMSVGNQSYIRDVQATFADGSTLNVENSDLTSFECDTPAVATVDANGMVNAIAPGVASIYVSYGGLSFQVPVTVRQPVAVAPSNTQVNASQAREFYVQLALPPGTPPGVTWSLRPDVGSIVATDDYAALYTAPSSVTTPTRVVVSATSVADPTKSGFAELMVLPPAVLSISPPSVSLTGGTPQEFSARVTNASDQSVSWTVTPTGIGTIGWDQVWSGIGLVNNLVYTAPAVIQSPQTVTVTATRATNSSDVASATVTLVPSVALSVGPATATLYASQTQQFIATLNYNPGASVIWSLNPNVGTIDAYGLYTAPATIPYQQAIAVVATASGGFTANATVTLVPRTSSGIAPPTGLTAVTASASEIDLSWSASPSGGIAGYSIFRNGTPVGTSSRHVVQ